MRGGGTSYEFYINVNRETVLPAFIIMEIASLYRRHCYIFIEANVKLI